MWLNVLGGECRISWAPQAPCPRARYYGSHYVPATSWRHSSIKGTRTAVYHSLIPHGAVIGSRPTHSIWPDVALVYQFRHHGPAVGPLRQPQLWDKLTGSSSHSRKPSRPCSAKLRHTQDTVHRPRSPQHPRNATWVCPRRLFDPGGAPWNTGWLSATSHRRRRSFIYASYARRHCSALWTLGLPHSNGRASPSKERWTLLGVWLCRRPTRQQSGRSSSRLFKNPVSLYVITLLVPLSVRRIASSHVHSVSVVCLSICSSVS